MKDNYISFRPADRIAQFKPYYFATLNQKLAQLRNQGVDVIRLDMGSPDLPPDETIIDTLISSALRPDIHGYSANGGTPAFRKAVATYYKNRFGVDLDSKTEVLGLIGSKEGLFHLGQVLINPGEIALVPDPGYPVYTSGAIIAGGSTYPLSLIQENHYLPDLDTIPEEVLKKTKILWLNYPNNPTGAVAPIEFFEHAIDFGRRHHILIAHDAPYVDVCFDGYRAPSLMQVSNAKDVAVEFNSLSKLYNMGGWRLGMVVGNPEIIRYLNTYKSQLDSSEFEALLEAGSAALTGDQLWLQPRNMVYKERRDIILDGIRRGGMSAETPLATIYIWMRLPNRMDSVEFCDRLLMDTGVSMTPGSIYGKNGEGFVRISLGMATNRIKEAMQRFSVWIAERSENGDR